MSMPSVGAPHSLSTWPCDLPGSIRTVSTDQCLFFGGLPVFVALWNPETTVWKGLGDERHMKQGQSTPDHPASQ